MHLQSIIFNKDAKNTQWRKDSLFMNGSVKPECPHAGERNWTLISHHIQKSTQNRLGLNVRPETMKLLSESIVKNLLNTNLGYDFYYDTGNTGNKSKKIDKWNYIRLKTSSQ